MYLYCILGAQVSLLNSLHAPQWAIPHICLVSTVPYLVLEHRYINTSGELLYHRNHKISPTLSADSISKEFPLHGHVTLENCQPFFQGQLEMFQSIGGEEEKKRSILNAVSLPPSPPSSVRGHAHTHALTRMYAHSHQKEGRKVLFRQMSKFPFPHCSSQSGHCLAPPVVMSLVNYILY